MNKFDDGSARGGAAMFAVWSMLSLLAGAVAGNRLDEAVRQIVQGVFGVPNPSWSGASGTLLANLLLVLVCGLVAFGVGLKLALPQFRRTFLKTYATVTRQDDIDAKRYQAVVLTLSRLEPGQLAQAEQLAVSIKEAIAKGADRRALLGALCDKDEKVSGLANRLSWQQTLRTIQYHGDRLKVLYFVLSPEAAAQFHVFLDIVGPLLSRDTIVRPADHATEKPTNVVDLTDYNKVSEKLRAACNEATRHAGCGHGDLCVDITAGQKIWSAASTIVTLNTEAAFGYVNTRADGDEGKVVIFNARILI